MHVTWVRVEIRREGGRYPLSARFTQRAIDQRKPYSRMHRKGIEDLHFPLAGWAAIVVLET